MCVKYWFVRNRIYALPTKKDICPIFKSSFQKLISKTPTDKFHVDQLIINLVDCFKQFSEANIF